MTRRRGRAWVAQYSMSGAKHTYDSKTGWLCQYGAKVASSYLVIWEEEVDKPCCCWKNNRRIWIWLLLEEQQCYASGGCAETGKTMKGFGCRMHSAWLQETCQGDLKKCLSRKHTEKMSWERRVRRIRHTTPPQTMTVFMKELRQSPRWSRETRRTYFLELGAARRS